jgi:magnesium-transporting ATPase (P-type)
LVRYDAGSPDELALVCGAQMCGVEFFSRTFLNRIQLRLLTRSARELVMGDIQNAKWEDWVKEISTHLASCPVHSSSTFATAWVPLVTFELFEVLEFDNIRKRMSVIIRSLYVVFFRLYSLKKKL